jgi:hypothetical protein
MNESVRREKAREAIQGGKLPSRDPDRMWGGPGTGANCAICNAPVKPDDIEFEIAFDRHGDGAGLLTYRFHNQCFVAWQFECLNLTGDSAQGVRPSI